MMNRMKHYKGRLWLSSCLTLLPIPIGFLLWNRLPNSMAIHWGANGEADGFGSKLLAILLPSLILLAVHWLCMLVTFLDKSNTEQNEKVFGLIFWVCPSLSILLGGFVYGFSLGLPLGIFSILYPIIGIPFALIGNYMPKCKQNKTIGIKTLRTLSSEENWNATHRFAGKVWVIVGFLITLLAFLPNAVGYVALPIAFLVAVILPLVYSRRFDKQRKARGETVKLMTPDRRPLWVVLPLLAVVFGACLFLMLSGSLEIALQEDSLVVKASFFDDLTVSYDEIDRVEYKEDADRAQRIFGYGSPKLSLGNFRSDELGNHTRYTYTQCRAEIRLYAGDRILVLNADTPEATQALYEQILSHMTQEVTP